MVKLTDDQYWAYRKAHACPIPKEDLEAQMFIGVAGSSENTQADNNTHIGINCTSRNGTQMPRINDKQTTKAGLIAGSFLVFNLVN